MLQFVEWTEQCRVTLGQNTQRFVGFFPPFFEGNKNQKNEICRVSRKKDKGPALNKTAVQNMYLFLLFSHGAEKMKQM